MLAPPLAAADQSTVTNPLASVTVEVPDATFEVTGCLDVPLTATVFGAGADVTWSLRLTARLEGTAPSNSEFLSGDGNDRQQGGFYLCPFEGAGRWIVEGTFVTRDYDLDAEYETPIAASFQLQRAATSTTLTRVRTTASTVVVSGRVTSQSRVYGVIGAPGEVLVQVKIASRGKWLKVGTGYAGSTGNYSVRSYKVYPKGSTYRARFLGTDSTNASTSATRRS